MIHKLCGIFAITFIVAAMLPRTVLASPGYRVKISFLQFQHEKLLQDDYKIFVEFKIPSINHYKSQQTPEVRYADNLTSLEFSIEKSWLGLSAEFTIVVFWHLNDVIIDINPVRADGPWIPGTWRNISAKKASALVTQYTLGDFPKEISKDGHDDGYYRDLNNDAYIKLRIETLVPKGYLQCNAYRNDVDIGGDTIFEVWAPLSEGGHVLIANLSANTVIELTCGTYLVRVKWANYAINEKNVTVAEDTTTYERFHWFDLIIQSTEGGGTTRMGTTIPPGTYPFWEEHTCIVAARPFEGYKFKHWILDGQVITTEAPETAIPMDQKHTLKAVFAAETEVEVWMILAVVAIAMITGLLGILAYRRPKVQSTNEIKA